MTSRLSLPPPPSPPKLKPAPASFIDQAVNILLEGIKAANLSHDLTRYPTGQDLSARVNQKIALARRGSNDLIPFHQLPPEMLTEVFLHSIPPGDARITRLEQLASVCSHWKALLTSTPLLWSSITSFDPPGAVPTALSRSCRSPLDINLFGGKGLYGYDHWGRLNMSTAIRAVIRDAERWKTVNLEVDKEVYGNLLPLQAATVPVLETLRITFKHYVDRSRGVTRVREIHETIDLFGGRAGCLQVLHLDGIPLPWSSPLLMQVSDLALANVLISPTQLYDLLDSNPRLKRLAIHNLMPCTTENDSQRPPASLIKHNNLEHISLGWTQGSPAPAVLAHVITPNCTSLIVEMGRQPRNEPVPLSPSANGTLTHITRHISTASFDDVKIIFVVQESPSAGSQFDVRGTFRLPNSYDLRFTLPVHHQGAERWLQTVLELLYPIVRNPVFSVEFDWQPYLGYVGDCEGLLRLLGELPNLKTMVNRYSIDGRLLQLMSRPGDSGAWLFTELEEFTVEHVHCREVLVDLLVMMKHRYGGVISDYSFGGESDAEDDDPNVEDDNWNTEDDNPDSGVGSDTTDAPEHTQYPSIIPGTPRPPPPTWKKLILRGLKSEHDRISAAIIRVANTAGAIGPL